MVMIVNINDRFVTISGYSRDEVIGKTSIELDLYENQDSRRKIVDELIISGHCENVETVFRTKNGSRLFGMMSSQVVFLYGAQHVYSHVYDLTERKKTEQLLINAQKLESLGILAGGIAHDFNNLLTGIFGYIDLACSISTDAQISEYLNSTLSTLNRAKALTMQLLTFAKGGTPVQKITDLKKLILETTRFALCGSNVSCSFFIDENLWSCNIDKEQISQVIDNIVINAQQAMPGGGTIEVAAQNVHLREKGNLFLELGDYVKVSIKDTGIGIPSNILTRIFDPFFTTKSKGHGLGLATCYSIVKRHGGCIEADSEPAKGSTFHFYLPASLSTEDFREKSLVRHRGCGKIMVVDDEEVVCNTVKCMLQQMGYSVVCVSEGQEAVDLYVNQFRAGIGFAAIILDLTIPGGMGGKEVMAEIRRLNEEVPIFVMSGYADDLVIKNPNEHKFSASLSKPFTIAGLSEMLENNMKKE